MDKEGTSLDDILGENEPEETAEAQPAETVAEAPEEAPSGPVRDEQGRFAAKTETGVDEQAPPATELPKEEYKAIREEREKRQNLERELEALKAQINQQPKEPPAPPPSIWEDEQGWQQHFGAQITQQASLNAKLVMSEMLARQSHEDFDAMKAEFLVMAEQNPALVQQALGDPHPWDKAYKIARTASTMKELGATDVATLEAKLREKIMAELEQGQSPVQPRTLPPTLTGERNVGSRSGPAWGGPTPFVSIFPD